MSSAVLSFPKFATEEACVRHLTKVRWPSGVRCPECSARDLSTYAALNRSKNSIERHECLSCGYVFSATVKTLFHGTHVPLTKWVLLIYLMPVSQHRISARQMQPIVGVSYETAWSMMKRVSEAGGKDKQLVRELFREV